MKKLLKTFFFIAGLLIGTLVFANTTTSGGISDVAKGVTSAFGSIAQLLLAIAYVAGIGFSVASVFKFKQHKDNPTQITIGTPIALMTIGVSLIFLGYLIKPLGQTLTGEDDPTTAGSMGDHADIPGLTK